MAASWRALNRMTVIPPELLKRLRIRELYNEFRFETDAKWFILFQIEDPRPGDSTLPIFTLSESVSLIRIIIDNEIQTVNDFFVKRAWVTDGFLMYIFDFSKIKDINL
jgi:lactam utilization protein B